MQTWIHTLTVDASVDLRRGLVGVGILIQERAGSTRRGPILDRLSECHLLVPPMGAEELAALRALQVAHERGYSRLKIRMDTNPVRRLLRAAHRAGTVLPGMRGEILGLAASFEFVDFGWVPRRKNQIAHALARHALGLESKTKRAGGASAQERTEPSAQTVAPWVESASISPAR